MAEFDFLLPPGRLTREGGGAYIRSLCSALTAAGHAVTRGESGLPGAIRIVDGAALAAMPLHEAGGAVALIHHTTALASGDEKAAMQEAERERLPLLWHVVTTSESVRDRLLNDYGADPAQVTAIRPGVPDVARSTGSQGADCVVLSVGALVPRKGHGVLMRALARLFDLSWRLVIVGDDTRDPAHAAALRAQADEAGIAGRVRFAGTLDDAALEHEWRGADMFALATEWEGYSAPVAEALRRGLPVAVTSGGAAADLIAPELGVVSHPGDADGFSKSMRRIIFDKGLRAEMAEAAWRAGQALPDWPAQAARFAEVAGA